MAFYKCSKCKRVWRQPVEVCPHCMVILEKSDEKEGKVIGLSKVNIPSVSHPNVPYFVYVLEDEDENKWVQKSVKEFKMGEEVKFLSDSDNDAVAVWRIKYDREEAIKKVVSLLGGIDLNDKSRVLIVPSLVSSNHPYFRDNTSPEFLDAAIQVIIGMGVGRKNVKVGAQSAEGDIAAMAKKSGLLEVCIKNNVAVMDFSKVIFLEKGGVEAIGEAFAADLILSLPIMKIGAGAAMNNILKIFKDGSLSMDVCDIPKKLQEIRLNILTVGEAEFVQRQSGFTSFMGLVVAGKNPLNVDDVFNEISGIGGAERTGNIPVVGREIEEARYNVEY